MIPPGEDKVKMGLSGSEVKLFREYIYDSAGLQLNKDDRIAKAVATRITEQGFVNPYNYFKYLKYHPQGSVELRNLLTLVTINESCFFRNEHQYKALREMVLPDLLCKKLQSSPRPSLSVWSAGCSSGEEPYSIAVEILEKVNFSRQFDIEILGTDVDKGVLKDAKKASYNLWRLRNVSRIRLEKYFDREGKKYTLKPSVRQLCSFDYNNLMDEHYPQSFFGKWDIIFCRNVFIYFNRETIKKVLKRFAEIINEGGYLFLGHSESLYRITGEFQPVQYGNAFIYKKTAEGEEVLPVPEPVETVPGKESQEVRVISPDEEARDEPLVELEEKEKEEEDKFEKAYELYIKENYGEAGGFIEEHLEKTRDLEGLLLAAKIFTEQNKLDKALEYACEAVEKDYLNPSGYFIAGIINQGKNDLDEAEKHLKKALYLQSDFGLAHFRLAEIYEKKEQYDKALVGYRNTLKVFEGMLEEEPLELGGGFTVKALSELARSRIRKLKDTAGKN